MAAPPSSMDRRIAPSSLARLLGRWEAGGPAYSALAAGLRRAVLDGSLPLGTRLPSERELAEALGTSRTTTAAAYQLLRDQGFLRTRRGSGSVTTVPGGPRPAGGVLGGYPGLDGEPADAVVDLTVAAPPAPPELHAASVRALEALPRHLSGTGYTHLGLLELREALAERYTRRGTPTAPDEILVTSGAQQGISLLLSTLVGPGDRVVVEHPTYANALTAVRAAGARAVPVPVGPTGLDLDLLESTIRQTAPRLVYLTPDHHNPTGLSLDDEGRHRVRELAARHRTLVVGDETLTDLTLDGPAPSSFSGPASRPTLAVVGSASKSFWSGLRIGWVRGHRDLVARLANERPHVDISTPVLEQLIAVELLAVADTLLPARRTLLRSQRDAVLDAVGRLLPWHVDAPAGGLSAWADLGTPSSSALAAVALQHGVRVAPGPLFGVDGSFENRMRLTFAQPAPLLELGVDRLAAAWQAVAARGTGGGARQEPRLAVV